MSYDIADGFDFANAINDLQQNYWDIAQTATLSGAVTPFGVGQSLNLAGSSNPTTNLQKAMSTNEATRFVSFYMKLTESGAGNAMYIFFDDSTNLQCYVKIFDDLSISILNAGNSVLASFPAAFSAGSWVHLQIEVTINSTTGAIHIRKNGATSDTFAATGLNTQTTGNAYSTRVRIGNNDVSTGIFYIDDLFLHNANAASAPSTFVGEIRSVQLMPASDVQKDFTPNTGSTNYTQVNEVIQNNFATWVEDASVNDFDLYTIGSLPYTPASIIGVTSRVWGEKTDAGSRSGNVVLKSSTTSNSSPSTALATGGMWLSKFYGLDPNTSGSWTAAAVNGIQMGPQVSA